MVTKMAPEKHLAEFSGERNNDFSNVNRLNLPKIITFTSHHFYFTLKIEVENGVTFGLTYKLPGCMFYLYC